MSIKNGYSISYRDDALVAVGVSNPGDGKWKIDQLEQNRADAGPSATFAREMEKGSDHLTMVIPGAEVRTSLITLPKLKKKELALAVNGWVAREESTPADQWSISWVERPRHDYQENSNKKDIFLFYAGIKDVGKQETLAQNWGGQPSLMVPEFMVLESMYRKFGRDTEGLKGWNIVFVGKDDQFLCVSTQDGPLLTRKLPSDLSEGEDAGEYLNRLATEVDRSIFFARQTELNPSIDRIIVCGDADLAPSLVARLKEETSIPAEYWDVASIFDWAGGTLDSRLMLPVMAAVLAHVDCPCNLLPPRSRNLLGPMARRRLLVACSTAAVFVVPLLLLGGFLTTKIQEKYLDEAKIQLSLARERADKAADIYKAQRVLLSREDHISSYSDNDENYAGVLLHLAALTPEEIIYKDLRMKESSEGNLAVYLTGESNAGTIEEAQQAFLKFKQALDDSDLLVAMGEARKLNITNEKEDDIEIKRVEFSMEYQVQDSAVVPGDKGEG